jgi:hypothetical protein
MRTAVAIGIFVLAFTGSLSAAAAAPNPDEVAAEATQGLFVEGGADPVDVAAIRDEIARAGDAGIDLTVVVLATDEMDVVPYAREVNDLVPGTVLVFSPSAYGASSDELSQSELDGILDDAESDLSGPDVAAGVAGFVDAATASTNWPLIIGLVVLVLVAVGIGGRVVERRATAHRRQEALDRRWTELRARADGWADPILDLSTRVELDGRPEQVTAYQEAADLFSRLRTELDAAPSADAVDRLEREMDELETDLDRLDVTLRPPDADA